MKLSIEQPKLAAALSRVLGAIEKRNTIQILSNVLINASGSQVRFMATDLDIQVSTVADAEVTADGSTTVNAQMLSDIVKKLSKGRLVELELSGNAVHIRSGRSDLSLGAFPTEDFPEMKCDDLPQSMAATARDVKRLFDLSALAMSSEETRYYLCGAYLHSVNGSARAVTTDGHRLAHVDSDIIAAMEGVIVPRKTVAMMRSLLDVDAECVVSSDKTKIRFDIGETVVTSKVIDGTFPDYSRVIPAGFTTGVTVDAGDMKRAGDLVATVSSERTKGVKITLSADLVSLDVQGGVDSGHEEVETEYDGPDFSIGCNSKYLAECLQLCNGENAEFEFSGPSGPFKVKPSDDDKVFWIQMHMRVN